MAAMFQSNIKNLEDYVYLKFMDANPVIKEIGSTQKMLDLVIKPSLLMI